MAKVTDKQYYMNDMLIEYLKEMHKAVVNKDFDGVLLLDGYEGYGKSSLAIQCAYYLNWLNQSKARTHTEFTVEKNILFTGKEFINFCLQSPEFSVGVFDEARKAINIRKAMSEMNVAITNMLSEIRQRHLFLIIVMPSFCDMDKNVSAWRSRALIHVVGKGFERGGFQFFGMNAKRELYFKAKKYYYNYSVVKPTFIGTFTAYSPFNESEVAFYKNKKLGNLNTAYEEKQSGTKTEEKYKDRFQKALKLIENKLQLQPDEVAKAIGISTATLKQNDYRVKPPEDNSYTKKYKGGITIHHVGKEKEEQDISMV